MKRRFGLVVLALLVVVPAILAVASSAPAQGGPGSSLGIQIVRFVKGTSPTQMRADVANAGGTVVADLSAASALAALPGSAGFSSAIAAQPGSRTAPSTASTAATTATAAAPAKARRATARRMPRSPTPGTTCRASGARRTPPGSSSGTTAG